LYFVQDISQKSKWHKGSGTLKEAFDLKQENFSRALANIEPWRMQAFEQVGRVGFTLPLSCSHLHLVSWGKWIPLCIGFLL
jgi:hypothetical protein